MKPILTIDELIESARLFCEIESKENHAGLWESVMFCNMPELFRWIIVYQVS